MNTTIVKKEEFNFKPFATAIGCARLSAGLTVEELAEKTGVTARYISAIENDGKRTSIKTLISISTYLNISIDEIIYPQTTGKTSKRRSIDAMLDQLDDKSIRIAEGVIRTLIEVNNDNIKED